MTNANHPEVVVELRIILNETPSYIPLAAGRLGPQSSLNPAIGREG
jgi:hypothetical protein